jgi:hypothetical protein
MATIIWCDKIRHVVQGSRSELERCIDNVKNDPMCQPAGFVYVTDIHDNERALNVSLISSFEAVPGDSL